METIDDSNYELWLMRYADGCLTADEREAVEQWLEGHPGADGELALYSEAPRLERDERVRYDAALQQHSRPLWAGGWRWAAAAAVALLLLTPAAIHLFADTDEPVQVAQATPPASAVPIEAPQEARTAPAVGTRRAVSAADRAVCTVAEERAAEIVITDEPLADAARRVPTEEPLLVAAEVSLQAADTACRIQMEEPIEVEADQHMVYATNLFVEDTTSELEQRLLALNDAAKERLQGTYLGRRLARRLPENQELLAQVDEARERTPRGIRILTDLVVKLIEVNSKEDNQQNSISL